ncbi:MAG TPA: A24 family peptidase [Anaerovoracaceae bacterium]|nr:A24 family peptidase [Anaerovoracaceae bacterium]
MNKKVDTTTILIKIVLSIAAGILAGFSAVYTFNRIPAKWLCDYNQIPDPGIWGERIKRRPWTMVFMLVFTASSLKLLEQGFLYAIPGLAALWLLLQIGIADKKYRIIPDQFILALAVTAFGFIPFHFSYQSQLIGALVGGGSLLLMGIVGKLLFKKEAMGFGDVKLLAAIGLLVGLKGVVVILILTSFSSAFVLGAGLINGKIKIGEEQPLGPFIAASTTLYILFQHELTALADFYIKT